MTEYRFDLELFSPELLDAYKTFPGVLGESSDRKIAWKYQANPFGQGCAMVVRNSAGEIVGMNGYQAATIANARGLRLHGHQSLDTVVTESARGQGLFTHMYQAYYAQTRADFVYGFPNKNSAHGFFTKLGWSRFGTVPMSIKPLRTGFIMRRFGVGAIDFLLPAFRRSRGTSARFTLFNDRHEQAWRSVLRQSNGLWGIDRTAAYLNWRYRDHPTNSYECRDRPDGTFVVSTILDKHGARILYVMEALGEAESLLDLLREVHADARRDGAELALMWGGEQPPLAGVFRQAGYYRFPDRLRSNEINFGVRVLTDCPAPRARREWLVSYSDSDTV